MSSYLDLLPPEIGHQINKYIDEKFAQQRAEWQKEHSANYCDVLSDINIKKLVERWKTHTQDTLDFWHTDWRKGNCPSTIPRLCRWKEQSLSRFGEWHWTPGDISIDDELLERRRTYIDLLPPEIATMINDYVEADAYRKDRDRWRRVHASLYVDVMANLVKKVEAYDYYDDDDYSTGLKNYYENGCVARLVHWPPARWLYLVGWYIKDPEHLDTIDNDRIRKRHRYSRWHRWLKNK
jgi:hypothetical protein